MGPMNGTCTTVDGGARHPARHGAARAARPGERPARAARSGPRDATRRSRAGTVDRSRVRTATATLAVLVWFAGIPASGVRSAAGQQAVPPPREERGGGYDTALMPMRASPLDRSLAELVASGWRVVGVTVSGRIFQYHLVGEDSLAVCFVNTAGNAPGSECVRLASARR